MNHKLPIAIIGLLACVSAPAQTPAPVPTVAPSVSFTATGAVVSQYMFRGQRLNGAGFQPTVEMAAGDFTAGVWGNFVLDNQVPDSSDPEIDLYASYTMKLEGTWTLVPGLTAYLYPSAPTSAGFYRSTFEPNLALSGTVDEVKLTPKIYYDTVLKGMTYEFTAAYALPLKGIGSELGFTATVGTYKIKKVAYNTTPEVKAWGDYWLLGVTMPFQLDKNSKLSLGYAYTEGRDAFTKQGTMGRTPNSLAIGRGVVTIGYTRSF